MRFLGFALVLWPMLCWGQPDTLWTRTLDTYVLDSTPTDIVCNNVVTLGYGSDQWHLIIEGLGQDGHTVWNSDLGIHPRLMNHGLDEMPNGGYALTCKNLGSGREIIRTGIDGSELWTRSLPDTSLISVATDAELVGWEMHSYPIEIPPYRMDVYWYWRVDSSGSLRCRTMRYFEQYNFIRGTIDHGLILFRMADNGYFVKLDSTGTQTWTLMTTRINYANLGWCDVSASGKMMAVYSDSSGSVPGIGFLCTRSNGTLFFQRRYSVDGYSVEPSDIIEVGGGFVLLCTQRTAANSSDILLLRTNANGDLLWQASYDLGASEYADAIAETPEGSYVVSGRRMSNNGSAQVPFVLKTQRDPALTSTSKITSTTSYILHPNFPNPFNSSTEISFELPKVERVSLKVFDLLGREVTTVTEGMMVAGGHRVEFDGRDLASGVYVYRLKAGNEVSARKMVVLK